MLLLGMDLRQVIVEQLQYLLLMIVVRRIASPVVVGEVPLVPPDIRPSMRIVNVLDSPIASHSAIDASEIASVKVVRDEVLNMLL